VAQRSFDPELRSVRLELSRRPKQRGQDYRSQADYEPDDPAGHILGHEHRAEGDCDADDAASRD
jgi:hypothetical protein